MVVSVYPSMYSQPLSVVHWGHSSNFSVLLNLTDQMKSSVEQQRAGVCRTAHLCLGNRTSCPQWEITHMVKKNNTMQVNMSVCIYKTVSSAERSLKKLLTIIKLHLTVSHLKSSCGSSVCFLILSFFLSLFRTSCESFSWLHVQNFLHIFKVRSEHKQTGFWFKSWFVGDLWPLSHP